MRRDAGGGVLDLTGSLGDFVELEKIGGPGEALNAVCVVLFLTLKKTQKCNTNSNKIDANASMLILAQ